jgi:hypothetical protein
VTACLTYRVERTVTHEEDAKGVMREVVTLTPLVEWVDHHDTSYCGCALPAGMWGAHGWHMARQTRESLEHQEKLRFAAERRGAAPIYLRAEWDKWVEQERSAGRMDAAGLHNSWTPYLGTPLAVEPCPAYRAAARQGIGEEKRRRTGRRKIYGEED